MTTQCAPDLATQLQNRMKGLSHPDGVLCAFIRKVTQKRQQSGLNPDEAKTICQEAIALFVKTTNPDTQVKCIHLITATRSQTGIDVLEAKGFINARGEWIKEEVLRGIDELYEFVQ